MRRKPKSPFEKYKYWVGMGVVILVFVIVLLTVGKPSSPKAKSSAKKTTSERTERIGREARTKRTRSSTDRLALKAKRRLERERRREEQRTLVRKGTSGTQRTARSTRETKTSVRVQAETGYILKGVFVDERGERYALIGERRARSGDVVAGRKIQEVKPDRVSVEYGGSSYEVKIGSPLF